MTKRKNNKINSTIDSMPVDISYDFITIASHQLRTPISVIRWTLDMLLAGSLGDLNEDQKEAIRSAYRHNQFVVKVVNELLRFSRLEEKGIQLQPKKINILNLIKKLVSDNKDFAKANNCEVKVNSNLTKTSIFFDQGQLEMILDSILNNALTYSKSKCLIEINLKETENFLILEIKDRGIGIIQDQQEKIFTKFFRGKNAVKMQAGGLGLNMYMAKRIIDASGGKIEFKSKENFGTTFKISLPFSKPAIDPVVSKNETPDDLIKREREFVNITVHELKAPLGVTKWSLEILKSLEAGDLNEKQLELVERIYRGNERLLTLVRDLLNLAKLQEGKFSVDKKEMSFVDAISDVVTGFGPEAIKKKMSLVWKKPQAKMPNVLADSSRLAQVITNLISNAIKYTPESGKVVVSLTKETGESLKKLSEKSKLINIANINNKKGYLVLAVTDTGIGIDLKDQEKLFGRFFRSNQVLNSQTEGTGLGLYITKTIVSLHNGDIWFKSVKGQGSTFYFSLPII